MKTLIYLVRHGESIGNKLRLCLGFADLDLTDLGREQASLTAKALADVKFSRVYSSDLKRAMSTARPNAEIRGIDVIPTKGLRELYFGEWENMSIADIINKYKEKYTIDWCEHFGTFVSPSGESVPELAKRMLDTVTKIAEDNPGECILCASHAAAIRALWGAVSGIEPQDLAAALPFPSNASYSILEYEGGVFTPVSYSNDGHLAEVFTTWRD